MVAVKRKRVRTFHVEHSGGWSAMLPALPALPHDAFFPLQRFPGLPAPSPNRGPRRPDTLPGSILSQIGTRITCALNDDKDIEAVLAGVSGAGHLRAILASLDSRQQAMILGHAVPMPMALRTRSYDETFYAAMAQASSKLPSGGRNGNPWGKASDPIASTVKPARRYEDLFGDDDD